MDYSLSSIYFSIHLVIGLLSLYRVYSFILNVISILGLALSIDYGLLLVSRYREEVAIQLDEAGYRDGDLPAGADMKELVRRSVVRTVATAGRTVSFSALTIACSITGLLIIRSPIFKTIAVRAISVSLIVADRKSVV